MVEWAEGGAEWAVLELLLAGGEFGGWWLGGWFLLWGYLGTYTDLVLSDAVSESNRKEGESTINM